MNFPPASMLRWLPGPALALAGVACVRWLAPALGGRTGAVITVVGYLVVPAGLAWFAARLGQRAAKRSTAAGVPQDSNPFP